MEPVNDRRTELTVGSGPQVKFTYTFDIQTADDISVVITPAATGTVGTPLERIASDSPASGQYYVDPAFNTTREVTINSADVIVGDGIVLWGDRAGATLTDFTTEGNYSGDNVNAEFTNLLRMGAENSVEANRALRLPSGLFNNIDLRLPTPLVAGAAIGLNAAGDGLTFYTASAMLSFDILELNTYDHIEWNGTKWVAVSNLTVAGNITTGDGTASVDLTMNGGATDHVDLDFQQAGNLRWKVRLERDSSGNDFVINRYNSSGAFQGTSLSIDDADGAIRVEDDFSATGNIYATGYVSIGDGASASQLYINGTSGTNSDIDFQDAGTMRWRIRSSNSSNAFQILDTNSSTVFAIATDSRVSLLGDLYTPGAAEFGGNLTVGSVVPGAINTQADELVVSTSSHVGMTLATTNTAATTNIYFAEGSNNKVAYISNHGTTHASAGQFKIATNITGGQIKLYTDTQDLALTLDSSQNATFGGDAILGANHLWFDNANDMHKIRLWTSDNQYSIGMGNGAGSLSYGGLTGYATTFTMSASAGYGWLWRLYNSNDDQGVMSLNTAGELTVLGDSQFDANLNVDGTLDVGGTTTLSGDILPDTIRVADIGSAAVPFADVFVEKLQIHPSNAGSQALRYLMIQGNISGTTSANWMDFVITDGGTTEQIVMRLVADISAQFFGDVVIGADLQVDDDVFVGPGTYETVTHQGTGIMVVSGTHARLHASGTVDAALILHDLGGTHDKEIFVINNEDEHVLFATIDNDTGVTTQAFFYFDLVNGEVDMRCVHNYVWSMGTPLNDDPTTDAPADWVEVKINGTSYKLPAYI